MFENLINLISQGYVLNGSQSGWRFLYSSQNTLINNNGFIFVGLNPSLREGDEQFISSSVENGNAYRTENWNGQGHELQHRVQMFFDRLAEVIDTPYNNLMDETLTMNFCPYRSSNWQTLHNPTEAIMLSNNLWTQMTNPLNPYRLQPRIIICNGNGREDLSPFYKMVEVFGINEQNHVTIPANIHNGNFRVAQNENLLIVGLPHLSHFDIFREVAREPLNQIFHIINARYQNNNDH